MLDRINFQLANIPSRRVLFKQLRESGMTLIVSSHILAELDEYSTHMLVMRGGRIVESRSLTQANGHDSNGRIQVRATLAEGGPELADRIGAAITALADVELQSAGGDGSQFVFTLPADIATRAALLRALVRAGLPVIGFADERENLHESYLRTMKTAPSAAAQEQAP